MHCQITQTQQRSKHDKTESMMRRDRLVLKLIAGSVTLNTQMMESCCHVILLAVNCNPLTWQHVMWFYLRPITVHQSDIMSCDSACSQSQSTKVTSCHVILLATNQKLPFEVMSCHVTILSFLSSHTIGIESRIIHKWSRFSVSWMCDKTDSRHLTRGQNHKNCVCF